KEGGHLFVSVPAYQALWSDLDVVAMHYRRYDRRSITRILEQAGFEITLVSYWNMILSIPAFVLRRSTGKGGFAAFFLPGWIDRLLLTWLKFESLALPRIPYPFGTSVLVYAAKR